MRADPTHLELDERPVMRALLVERHGDVAVKHGGRRVDQRSALEMDLTPEVERRQP